MAPALSVARAVRTWLADASFLHVKEDGALVSWPSTVGLSRNSIFVTLPSGSLVMSMASSGGVDVCARGCCCRVFTPTAVG
jgi:hypothetical protein